MTSLWETLPLFHFENKYFMSEYVILITVMIPLRFTEKESTVGGLNIKFS